MKPQSTTRKSGRQQGVVLLITLVVLVVLLAGGVAIMRSMNASLFSAGNLAFKRDLINQGERAVSKVLTLFAGSAALASPAATAANQKASNYVATPLPTNAQGVPTALLSNTEFDTIGQASNDIADSAAGVTIRYVIDRLCTSAGSSAALGKTGCVYPPSSTDVRGGSSQEIGTRLPPPPSTIYRLSIRVTGPRDTQVFLQTSFAKPD